MKPKLIRTSTISMSLDFLIPGQLDFLNNYYDVIAVSGEDNHLETVRKREGVKTIDVKMERSISPFKDLKTLFKLYRVFKKEKPHIVHSITPKAGLLSMLAAKAAGVPIRIHTFTGLIFPSKTGVMQKLLIQMDRVLCWAATDIYPEGNGILEDLVNYKITKKPLKVIANGNVNGIDTSHFDPAVLAEEDLQKLREEIGIQSEDFVFVFVGRLVQDKGINELLYAFQMLSEKVSKAKLLLVGFFEKELDPLNLVSERILASNKSIIYVGFQKDVRPYFAISDALAFPSYREGFPNVVMQAGAMGLPSIVTDINGCNEIIIEGKNGTIIPVKNETALYEAMLKFMEDKTYYHQLKQNARSMITNRYEQQVVWEALLEEYNRLLIEKGSNTVKK